MLRLLPLALLVSLAAAQTSLTTRLVTDGLQSPTFATAVRGEPERLFVTERAGQVRIVRDGVLEPVPFLDLVAATGAPIDSLYSMAFHPDYGTNGYFFVYYLVQGGGTANVERYQVSAGNPDVADPTSGTIIVSTPSPLSSHSGAGPVFGPDGTLFVAYGDGSSGDDPACHGQNGLTFFGSILRIDVDAGTPYVIPPDNPFLGDPNVAPETWAMGLRNPWRVSFDRDTGDFWIADVGQASREEIDFEPAGAGGRNYGWSVEEGSLPYSHHCPPNVPPYGDPGYTRPIFEYDHTVGCSITGGYVYRGDRIRDLRGTYFFADYCGDGMTKGIWSLRYENGTIEDFMNRTVELQPPSGGPITSIVSFAEDGVGELYILSLDGKLFEILPACGTYPYCDANANSTGAPAVLVGEGSTSVSANDLTLHATGVPAHRFGYFLMSATEDFVPLFGGGDGNLCLGAPILRFAKNVLDSGAAGELVFDVDLLNLPGGTTISPGETWRFQAWFRDVKGGPTSNASNGLRAVFCP